MSPLESALGDLIHAWADIATTHAANHKDNQAMYPAHKVASMQATAIMERCADLEKKVALWKSKGWL